MRASLIAHLRELIDGYDTWKPWHRDELVGTLKGKPGLRRYLRRPGTGVLRIDAAAAAPEAHLDGKWLLRTSDATLTTADLADAYKQLTAVEIVGLSAGSSRAAPVILTAIAAGPGGIRHADDVPR